MKKITLIAFIIILNSCSIFDKSNHQVSQKSFENANNSADVLYFNTYPTIDTSQKTVDSLLGIINKLKLDTSKLNKQLDSIIKVCNSLEKTNIELKSKISNTANCLNETEILKYSTLARRITFKNSSFDIFVVDLKRNNVVFYWQDSSKNIFTSFANVKKQVEKQDKELIFATNAGIYKPNYSPEGLYIENGKKLIPINKKQPPGYANFYMNFGNEPNSNGIFTITKQKNAKITKTNEYKYNKNIEFATQSGPLLLRNGKINPKFTNGSKNKKVRNGVGVINSSRIVFIISNEPVNFYDFASIFKNIFKCNDALYLDGVISKMYLPQINRTNLNGDFAGIITVVK